jgi:hypothetical protein
VQARGSGRRDGVPAMLSGLVAMSGVALLLVLAVCIGASLDIEVQRRERRRLADERPRRNSCGDGAASCGPLCERCPYRR